MDDKEEQTSSSDQTTREDYSNEDKIDDQFGEFNSIEVDGHQQPIVISTTSIETLDINENKKNEIRRSPLDNSCCEDESGSADLGLEELINRARNVLGRVFDLEASVEQDPYESITPPVFASLEVLSEATEAEIDQAHGNGFVEPSAEYIVVPNESYSSEKWFELWSNVIYKTDNRNNTFHNQSEDLYPLEPLSHELYTNVQSNDTNISSSSYFKIDSNGNPYFVLNSFKSAEGNSYNNGTQKDLNANLSVKFYTLSNDEVEILKQFTKSSEYPPDLTDEDLRDLLQICSMHHATLARLSTREISDVLKKVFDYSKRLEGNLEYWMKVRDSLQQGINLHNLSIKTLIQLTQNTIKKQTRVYNT